MDQPVISPATADRKSLGRRIRCVATRPAAKFEEKTFNNPSLDSVACGVLQQRFEATGLNRVWVGDFTMVATRAGWLYVAVLLDLCSRRMMAGPIAVWPINGSSLRSA